MELTPPLHLRAFVALLPTLVLSIVLVPLSIVCFNFIFTRLALLRKPLPPGPSLLTRLLDRWRGKSLVMRLTRWGEQYGSSQVLLDESLVSEPKFSGDVMSLMDFVHLGEPTIVLGSPKAAVDLLEKRGNIYSSRPRNILGGKICYRDSKGTLMQMGPKLRKFRTLMSVTMGVDPSKQFRPLENVESKILLRDLILEDSVDKYRNHVERSIYSVAFFTAYGQRVKALVGTDLLEFFIGLLRFFRRHSLPGGDLVDHFPVLLHLPHSLQWFRKEAERRGDIEELFFKSCLYRTKSAVSKGLTSICSAARALERQSKLGLSDVEIAFMAAAPYSAGIATTLRSFEAFTAAMVLNPHVMKKVQEEIDAVVGPQRMPGFEDFDSLPYVRATIKETLRWHPAIPLGLPHAVTEDDVYDGMFIPAGSTVIANIYAITRNRELFPDPEKFEPERFLDKTDPILKNYSITFGFGRRICPGQHIASDQLFLLVSRVLWAFDILPLNSNLDLLRQPAQDTPVHLPYKLVPRADHVRSIIMEEALMAEEEAKAWECYSPS